MSKPKFKLGEVVLVPAKIVEVDKDGDYLVKHGSSHLWYKGGIGIRSLHDIPSEGPSDETDAVRLAEDAEDRRLWAEFAKVAINALIHKAPLLDAEGEHGPAFDKATLTQFRRDMAVSAFDYADAMLDELHRRFPRTTPKGGRECPGRNE